MSAHLLRVDASPHLHGASRTVTDAFVHAWQEANPAGVVTQHDLVTLALPHLGPTELGAWFTPPRTRPTISTASCSLAATVSSTTCSPQPSS